MADPLDPLPLSPEAEIVLVRKHLYDHADKLQAVVLAAVDTNHKVDLLQTHVTYLRKGQDELHHAVQTITGTLVPIATHVDLLKRVVYGLIAVVVLAVIGALVAVVVHAPVHAAAPTLLLTP